MSWSSSPEEGLIDELKAALDEARKERDERHLVAWQLKTFLGQSIHERDRRYAGDMTQKHEWLCDRPTAAPAAAPGEGEGMK